MRLIFTNGVFDLLHVGHIDFLEACRHLGDSLIVAINDDNSVRALKGGARPICSTSQRLQMLNALRCVDSVRVFADEDGLRKIIEVEKPHVICKGVEYCGKPVTGSEFCQVVFIPMIDHISTTKLIERIRS